MGRLGWFLLWAASFQLAIVAVAQEKKKQEFRKMAPEFKVTKRYAHDWEPFPEFTGEVLETGEELTIKAKPGRSVVVVFLASWCIPCQNLIRDIIELDKFHRSRFTDFVYVFSHDTRKDALAFVEHLKMDGIHLIANRRLLRSFKVPTLLSLYLSDRRGWLTMRKIATMKEDLGSVQKFLRGLSLQ